MSGAGSTLFLLVNSTSPEPFTFGWAELLFVVVSAAIILGQGFLRGWGGRLSSRLRAPAEAEHSQSEPSGETSSEESPTPEL